MRHPRASLSIVPWLFCLFALIDITLAVVRTKLLHHTLTDITFVALARAQVCLLFTWLALGKERLRWRLAGTLAGTCFVFLTLTYASLARISDIGDGSVWLDDEWQRFFSNTEAGAFLLTAPWYAGATALPLMLWRVGILLFTRRQVAAADDRMTVTRFGMIDALAWLTSACLLMVIIAIAPYRGWEQELWKRFVALFPATITGQQLYLALTYALIPILTLLAVRDGVSTLIRTLAITGSAIVWATAVALLTYSLVWPANRFELLVFVIAAVAIHLTLTLERGLDRVIGQLLRSQSR